MTQAGNSLIVVFELLPDLLGLLYKIINLLFTWLDLLTQLLYFKVQDKPVLLLLFYLLLQVIYLLL